MTAVRYDIVTERWAFFSDTFDFEGFDFTGATFALQVRLYRDAPGDPLISLVDAAEGNQGLYLSMDTIDGIPWSYVRITINEGTLNDTLLNQGKAGTDVVLVYDLVMTASGSAKTRLVEGNFIIKAGATQA